MKFAKQVSTVLFTAALVVAAALTVKPVAHSSNVADNGLETITVSAQRMSAEQKAAFDLEEANTPSITVSARRMSNAEKAAFDRASNF